MTYELWDRGNRNCVGVFDSRTAAFSAARAVAEEHPDLTDDLELAGEDERGELVLRISGKELVDMASHSTSRRTSLVQRQ